MKMIIAFLLLCSVLGFQYVDGFDRCVELNNSFEQCQTLGN